MADAQSIAAIVESQRRYFNAGHTRPLDFRLAQLDRLSNAISENEQAILEALYKDLHKPRFEAFSSEIGILYEEIRHIKKHLPKWVRPRKVSTPLAGFPGKSYLYAEPLGAVLIISPWNYPFQLLMAPLVGAIAAGNCAVLKPSELAPATSQVVASLIKSAFAPEFVAVVEGGRQETESLLENRFDHIFFTGGTAVGKVIMTAAAKFLTPVTLELGGKSPCIVDEDADLEVAARRITWGKFFNAGQTCVAPDYLLVHRKIHKALLEKIQKNAVAFYGENPAQSPHYGRIINKRHFDRLTAYLESDKVVFGGTARELDLYIAPTVMDEISPESPVMQEEIFGPILPVLSYATVEEALKFVNDRPKPLAFYYFSKDRARQRHVVENAPFGGGCVNDVLIHLFNPNLPFGGVGDSGIGAYHGKDSFDVFSHRKSVFKQSPRIDLPFRYPPYTDRALALVKWIQKGF